MPREIDTSLNKNIGTGFQAHRVRTTIISWIVAERSRWVLWWPVLLACGIAVYFQLPREPSLWIGPGVGGVLAGGWLFSSAIRRNTVVFLLLLIPVLGFSAAQFRTYIVFAPVLEKKTGPVWVVGTVMRWEPKNGGHRVTLSNLAIDRMARQKAPSRVRITVKGAYPDIRAGDRLRVMAVLHPPAGPAMPGAFNFAQQAYFKGLGAVGYAVRKPQLLESTPDRGIKTAVARFRQSLTERIVYGLPGVAGSIAAALITGERGNIPEDVLSAMRESGLAHLLAISGLHIGLVAGILFFVARFLLSISEPLALHYPIKKWAAGCAFIGSFFYLLISGMTLPTQRAFLMLSLAMLAVILDRRAISMHMVAWAGCAILICAPDSLFNVSFQMSFAAVVALVAVYEWVSLSSMKATSSTWRIAFYLAGVLLTTVVAGVATAPFALFHFNQVALYGILANIFAVPITGFLIMPFAIVAMIAMPFGLEGYPLVVMGLGIEGVVWIAQFVQGLPGAVYDLPAMNGWLLGAIAFGGLWVCLWQHSVRYLGAIPIFVALFMMPGLPMPDVYISSSGNQIAVRETDGELFFVKGRRGIVVETWLRRTGNKSQISLGHSGNHEREIRCDNLACVFQKNGQQISLLWHPAAISEDCSRADIVVATIPVSRRACRTSGYLVDRFDLWRNGNHVVFLNPDGIVVKSIGSNGGQRPWSRYPRAFKRRHRPINNGVKLP
jgi:competence protein ComEC